MDSLNRADIAFLSAEAAAQIGLVGIPGQSERPLQRPDHGGIRVLLEGQFTFDVVDRDSDLTGYRFLILPDVIEVDDALQQRIVAFVAGGGGRVLLTASQACAMAAWHSTSARYLGGDQYHVWRRLSPAHPALQAEGVSDPSSCTSHPNRSL